MTSDGKAKGKDADNNGTTTCCRLCLSLDPRTKTSVIVDAISDPQLPKKIYEIVNVKIIAGDKYSTMVCTPCIDKINMWFDYKETCLNNQKTLEEGLHNSETLKEIVELTDSSDHDSVAANCEIPVTVKNESIEVEYEELPPPLTPQDQHNEEVEISEEKPAIPDQNNGAHNREENPTANSQKPNEGTMPCLEISSMADQPKQQDSREKKAFLTENLRLVAKNSAPVESSESLTKIEQSYIEKCLAMSRMHSTLKCACHHVSYQDLKSLLTHLRNSPLGFPVYTCYNCMITFADRSSKTRHSLSKCPKRKLEALIKLSNLRERSKIKSRIYQNYKCSECNHLYSFHEDFCAHVDESHNQSFPAPFRCSCERVFTSFEDYKSHAYISCLIEYHCDICSVSVKTRDDFLKHAADCHDSSAGFPILQDDNYKQRRPRTRPVGLSSVRRVHSKEATSVSNIIQGKRPRRASAYLQLREIEEYSDRKDVQEMSCTSPISQSTPKTKASPSKKKSVESSVISENTVINPASVQKNADNICGVCGKKCSTNYNLMRHLDTHTKKARVNETNTAGSPGTFEKSENSKKSHLTHSQSIKPKQHPKKQPSKEMHQLHPELEQHKNIPLLSSGNKASIVMCEICDTMFLTEKELKQHKLIHEIMPVLEPSVDIDKKDQKLVKYYDCKLCDKSYLSNGSLWKHSKRFHPEFQPTTYCELCDREFYKSRSYNRHKLVHLKNNGSVGPSGRFDQKQDNPTGAGYTSVFRPKPSPAKRTLPSLTQNETDVKSPFIYTCDVCVEIFSSKSDLVKHKKKHAQEQMPANQKHNWAVCKFCKMSFSTSDELDNHVKQKHDLVLDEPETSIKQFGCTQCPKVFSNRFALSSHGRLHKRPVEGEKIEEPKVKKVKMDVAKPAAPLFKCSQCKAVMPNDIALQIHILEKHGNVDASALPARCCTCNLDFPNHKEYEKHKELHTLYQKSSIQKNFSCNECSAAFTRSDDLDIHRRQFHTKEDQAVREYKCTLCNRVFDKQNFLDIHLKVHQKQKLMVSQPKPLPTTC